MRHKWLYYAADIYNFIRYVLKQVDFETVSLNAYFIGARKLHLPQRLKLWWVNYNYQFSKWANNGTLWNYNGTIRWNILPSAECGELNRLYLCTNIRQALCSCMNNINYLVTTSAKLLCQLIYTRWTHYLCQTIVSVVPWYANDIHLAKRFPSAGYLSNTGSWLLPEAVSWNIKYETSYMSQFIIYRHNCFYSMKPRDMMVISHVNSFLIIGYLLKKSISCQWISLMEGKLCEVLMILFIWSC